MYLTRKNDELLQTCSDTWVYGFPHDHYMCTATAMTPVLDKCCRLSTLAAVTHEAFVTIRHVSSDWFKKTMQLEENVGEHHEKMNHHVCMGNLLA